MAHTGVLRLVCLVSLSTGSIWLAACSSSGQSAAEDAGAGGNAANGDDSGAGSTSENDGGAGGTAASDGGASSAPESGSAAGGGNGDAGADGSPGASPDASTPPADGGAARNTACTPLSQETGTLIDTSHGRLDGTLVYVLPVGGSSACNGDDSHVHLQIEVSGNVYDVAVDIGSSGDDVGMYETTLALPGGPWAEGWHGADALGYTSLGLHSTEFPVVSPSTAAADVESLLEDTSEISIFCTGYSQGDGCHDVHYEDGTSNDGAIVLNPTAATPSIVFFRFSDETF
jgi:hypothetical protein